MLLSTCGWKHATASQLDVVVVQVAVLCLGGCCTAVVGSTALMFETVELRLKWWLAGWQLSRDCCERSCKTYGLCVVLSRLCLTDNHYTDRHTQHSNCQAPRCVSHASMPMADGAKTLY